MRNLIKKRKLRKEAKIALLILVGILLVCIIVLISRFNINFIGKKSIHDDAEKMQTKDALVFYPNSSYGKKIAKELNEKANKNDILDYALIPYGDYFMVKYPDGTSYFVDGKNNDLKIGSINEEGKRIISDYLRYTLKKQELDEAYTYDFLVDTYYENINMKDITYKIEGTDLAVHHKKYDCDFKIPLKYMEEACGINLGYNDNLYVKPRYISSNRKMICFTFDDGPDMTLKTSSFIVDALYKLDSSATFYIAGYRLGENQINFCKEAVNKGMEYGSHTQSHKSLTKLSTDEIYEEIMTPYHDLYDGEFGFGYEMKTFRPPYGNTNDEVTGVSDLTAVLWNVDSLDWKYRTVYDHDECIGVIYDKVVKEANENDVILFHEIYETSVDAASKLLDYFIKEGYQVVSVSELMKALNINDAKVFRGQ